jgi:molybdopterin molybdotransferase
MISVEEAQKKIQSSIPATQIEAILLEHALGRVLAAAIKSPLALPLADNSAMDGYAVCIKDIAQATEEKPVLLKIAGVIKAGDTRKRSLKKGECLAIMTGALIPQGSDGVLAKEIVDVQGRKLLVRASAPQGNNIRFQGEEVKKGQAVIAKSTVIHPGVIGLLATLGLRKVPVFKLPKVSVIATGNELVEPGKKLAYGKIYESNTWMIRSALEEMRIHPTAVQKIKDDPKELRKKISKALKENDVLILMGGVSVGDYDYVKEILGELGVKTLFWKIKQKPGKPLFYGKKGKKIVFGLPGNPASVLTCFYEYVYPALRKFSGFKNCHLRQEEVLLKEDLRNDPHRTLFLKTKITQISGKKEASALRGQGSHMLSSFVEANALMVIPPSTVALKKGQKVSIDWMPYASEVLS